jgi:putative type-1 restriction enzyme hindVIIP specificity protein
MSDNFKTDTLDSLCELIVDCPHSTPTWTTNGYVVIRNQNINDGVLNLSSPSYTDFSGYKDRTKRASPQENDIVITREAPMGRVCLIPKEPICCLGQRQVLLRADKNKISAEYLYWSLRSPFVQRQILVNEGTGATVSNMRIPVLKALEIPRLESIEIENKKARDLSNLQNKIQLNTQINQTLEQIAQALFKSWFVDFDPVRAKVQALSDGLTLEQAELAAMQEISGKTPEELTALSQAQPDRYAELVETAKAFPCEMVEVDGGEVPKGWEVSTISECSLKIQNGGTPKRSNLEFWENGEIPWLSSGEVCNNKVLVQSKEYITDLGLKGSAAKLIPPYSTLVAIYASPTAGKCAFSGFETSTNQAVCAIIPKEEYTFFNYYHLQLQEKYFANQASGSAQQNISKKIIEETPVLIPNKVILKKFNLLAKPIMNKTIENLKENNNLERKRDLLLPKLLNGDIQNE